MNRSETKDNKDEKSKLYDNATTILGIAGAVGAVVGLASWLGFYDNATTIFGIAGAVGAVVGLALWLGSGSKEKGPQEKMMKAPGKDGYISRNDFKNNPKDYFKDLRGKK